MDNDTEKSENEIDEEKILNQYLQELISLQDSKLLREEDLTQLEQKFPISPGSKEKIQMLSSRHISRAEQSKRQERWDTAIVEMERALLFTPLDEQIRLELAELYVNRSRQYGYLEKDLHRADEKVKETLQLYPKNRSALKMQKEMQELYRMLNGKDQNRKMIPVIIGILLILAAVSYPRIRQFFFWNKQVQSLEETVSSAVEDWQEKELLVQTTDSLNERIKLEIDQALLQKEETGFNMSFKGYIESNSGPIEEITLKMTLGNISDPVFEKTISVLKKDDPPLFSGATLSFSDYSHLTGIDENTESLLIQLDTIAKSESSFKPEEWTPSIIQWKNPKPDGINLQIESRQEKLLEGYDAQYLFQDIRVENRSITEISDMEIMIQWMDKDQPLASRTLNLIPPGNPPMKAQSVQSYRVLLDLSKNRILPPAPPLVMINSIKENTNGN